MYIIIIALTHLYSVFHGDRVGTQSSLQSVERMVTTTNFFPDSDTDQAVFMQQESSQNVWLR